MKHIKSIINNEDTEGSSLSRCDVTFAFSGCTAEELHCWFDKFKERCAATLFYSICRLAVDLL